MKQTLITLFLIVAVTVAVAETNPPAYSAAYWKSNNGITDRVTVKPSGDSWMIYTNGVASGVLTKDIDQAAVATFIYGEMEVDTPLTYDRNGNILPPTPTSSLGTTNEPWAEGHFQSNSVTIGGVKMSAEEGGIKMKKLIVDNGQVPGGKTKHKKGDVEISDVGYGVVYTDTNTVQWLHWVDEGGLPQTTQIAASPEIPLTNRWALMEEKRTRVNLTRGNWNGNGQIQDRLEQIEKLLGLRELDQ